MEAGLIERRATRGVGLLTARMMVLQVLTAGVTIALARLLTVADYGVFAIALAVQQGGRAVVELGVPAALIGRDTLPNPHEQGAVTGFFVVAALLICGLVAVVAFAVLPSAGINNHLPVQVFLACLALPFLAARSIPTVLMERQLNYGKVTAMYTVDTLVFNFAALGLALAGAGAASLTSSVAIGAFSGYIAAMLIQPYSKGVNFDFRVIRPLLSFGSQVGGIQALRLGRDIGFVSVVAIISSQTTAGYYAMSQRILGVPTAISFAIGRVGFPALARSEGTERIAKATRAATLAATGVGLPIALTAGATQAFVGNFLGDRWLPTTDVLLPSAAGLLLTASVVGMISSLCMSLNDARLPLASAAVEAASLIVAGAALAGFGAIGVGIAVLVASFAGVIVLWVRTPPGSGPAYPPAFRALAIASVAGAAGYLMPGDTALWGFPLAAAASLTVWTALSLLFDRSNLRSLCVLTRRSMRPARPSLATPGEAT